MINHQNRSTLGKFHRFYDALKNQGVEISDDQISAAAKALTQNLSQVDTAAIEDSAEKVGLNCHAKSRGKFSVSVHISNKNNGGTQINYSVKGRDVWIVVEDFDCSEFTETKWCIPRPEIPKPEKFFKELFENELDVSVVLGIDPTASIGYCKEYWGNMKFQSK
jgi:hypothetical protein